jgi:hypothetical protein
LSGEEATQLSSLASNVMGLLADEDIQQVAADIPNNSAAGLVLFEHTWAIGLKEAIKNAGAVVITGSEAGTKSSLSFPFSLPYQRSEQPCRLLHRCYVLSS